jgi:predicted protein tyrosine phosphatase
MRMQVLVMGLLQAEAFTPASGDACLSILTPGTRPEGAALKDGWRAVLRLWFNDLPGNRTRHEEGEITPVQADDIVRFVRTAEALSGRLVIHCEAGASRAPSIALAFEPLRCPCDVPNRTVYDAIRSAIARERQYSLALDRIPPVPGTLAASAITEPELPKAGDD